MKAPFVIAACLFLLSSPRCAQMIIATIDGTERVESSAVGIIVTCHVHSHSFIVPCSLCCQHHAWFSHGLGESFYCAHLQRRKKKKKKKPTSDHDDDVKWSACRSDKKRRRTVFLWFVAKFYGVCLFWVKRSPIASLNIYLHSWIYVKEIIKQLRLLFTLNFESSQ